VNLCRRTTLYAAALLISGTSLASAATYYVSPTGSGSNAGTPAAPWSMSKANSSLLAGDVAVLLPGTYGTGIAPANSGSSYSKFIAYVGSVETPATTIVPSINFGSGSTARHHVSAKGVTVTSSTTMHAPNDSLSSIVQTTGTFYIELGGDDCVVANSAFNGDRLWIEGGTNSSTATTVNRDTLYNNAFNLYMDGFGAAIKVSTTDGLYLKRNRFLTTIGPNGDHGTFKVYGSRNGRFNDNLFDITVLRPSVGCDDCGQSYFRDYTMFNVFLRDTFNLRGTNYNAMFLTASGSFSGSCNGNKWDSCVFRQEAPGGPGVLYWQNGADADTIINCVVISQTQIPIVMAGVDNNALIDHNTFVYLGTNGHAGDTYAGGAFDWGGPGTVSNNIFYSPRGGTFAYGVSSAALSAGYTGDNNLLYNGGSGSSLMWASTGTSPGASGTACKSATDECHSKYGDPLLVGGADVWTFDPHLKLGSPAIAADASGSDVGALRYGTGAVDLTAPSRVTDLACAQTGNDNVLLSWTAPGDDGSIGTAAAYELRMSTSAITDANFASAGIVAIALLPLAAGSRQQFVVGGLTPNTQYYFAIRAIDDVLNKGLVSNDAITTTLLTDTIPPNQVQDLNAGP